MYSGKKKGIIIAIIIILLLIVLGVGGFFVYATTDLFKSEQTLFLKYLGKSLEKIEYLENTQMEEVSKLQEKETYKVEGKGAISLGEDENSSELSLSINSNIDKSDTKAHTKATLNYRNDKYDYEEKLFEVEYAQTDNIHALKSDEIVTAYLGVENENLKVLAQKLGIYDTSYIPDSLKFININELLKLSNEEKSHIIQTYGNVLTQSTAKENYSKQSEVNVVKEGTTYVTTSYRLDLSAQQTKQIVIDMLEVLKEDSRTLNIIATKAKEIGLDENYTEINRLTTTIDNMISKIKSSNVFPEKSLSIVIYVKDGEVITTDIIIQNSVKINFYNNITEGKNENVHLTIENLSGTDEFDIITIDIYSVMTSSKSAIELLINIDDEKNIEFYIENNGQASDGTIATLIEAIYSDSENTFGIKYEQEMVFGEIDDIIKLSNSNCAILNNYTTEQLETYIITPVSERIQTVFTEKELRVVELEIYFAAYDANSEIQNNNNSEIL